MHVFQRSIVNELGNVVPSASVEVRNEVTSGLAQLYSDYAGASAIGNPITADANGFVRFYVDSGRYRITATSGAFSRIWENEILGLNSADIKYDRTAAEIAAGVTPINYAYPYLHAFRYAVGDSTTDVTVALQAVIDMMDYGEALFIPALKDGQYFKISGANGLTIPAGYNLNFYGESQNNSRIHNVTAGGNVFTSLGTYGVLPSNKCRWSYLHITATNGKYGLKLRANSNSTIENIQFAGFNFDDDSACLNIADSISLTIFDNRFEGSKNGIYSVGNAGSAWNGGGCTSNLFESLSRYGIYADYINGVGFDDNTIETCQLGGVYIYLGGGGFSFTGNYFEENLTYGTAGAVEFFDIYLGESSYINGVAIKGNYFNGNTGEDLGDNDYIPIRIKYGRGFDVSGNTLNTGTNFVKFADDAQITDMRFGVIGFHPEAGASFDYSETATATYSNLPAKHAHLELNVAIEGVSRFAGTLNQQYVRQVEVPVQSAMFTAAVAGTGAVSAEGKGTVVATGATAASTAIASIPGLGLSKGLGQASVNYVGIEIIGDFMVSNIGAGTSTGISFLMLSTAAVAADPTTRSVGFKIIENAIWGLTHNGTSLTLVNLNTSLSAGILTGLRFIKTETSVKWYVNGVLKGSTSTNVASSTAAAMLVLSAANGANSATQRLGLYDAKFTATQ